jgi:hypothetical protein
MGQVCALQYTPCNLLAAEETEAGRRQASCPLHRATGRLASSPGLPSSRSLHAVLLLTSDLLMTDQPGSTSY